VHELVPERVFEYCIQQPVMEKDASILTLLERLQSDLGEENVLAVDWWGLT
jgi:hypothetical protein